jgi:hypothetical protein
MKRASCILARSAVKHAATTIAERESTMSTDNTAPDAASPVAAGGRPCPTCRQPLLGGGDMFLCMSCRQFLKEVDGELVRTTVSYQMPPGWDDEEDPE